MTVRPSAPSRRNRSMRRTRWTGSAPLSGSSSTSTGGSVTRAAATLARWRIPLLNPPRRRSAAGIMSTSSSARSAAPGVAARRGGRRRSGTSWRAVSWAGTASSSGTRAMRRWTSRSGAGIAALDPDPSGVHADQPGDGPHERALAGAVGPEQAGDAGAERAAPAPTAPPSGRTRPRRPPPPRWRRRRRPGRSGVRASLAGRSRLDRPVADEDDGDARHDHGAVAARPAPPRRRPRTAASRRPCGPGTPGHGRAAAGPAR